MSEESVANKKSLFTKEAHEQALKVAAEFDARVYVYSGDIEADGFTDLILCSDGPDRSNSFLILTTYGGFASTAYQIARFLQETSDVFYLCIPAYCKSAGTLLALGAHKLFMSIISELGPLDVQLRQRDEIGQRRSGMVMGAAFEGLSVECFNLFEKIMLDIKTRTRNSISFEKASLIASNIVCGVMAPVYEQINPSSLGSDLRDLQVATAYGERLAKFSNNLNPGTIDKLVKSYPSHDFIIDQTEAKTLFKNVEYIPKSVSDLMEKIKIYI